MITVLIFILSAHLAIEFFGSFVRWLNAKSKYEYWIAFCNTMVNFFIIVIVVFIFKEW